MSRSENVQKLFDQCKSNLEAPLIGHVYTPVCYRCKNLIEPKNPFEDCACRVYGDLPDKYWFDDKEQCSHKIPEE